ncbi:MAG TPA: MerR family transcriptional regulator [Saliniramus sp.]|nr:MerR family transcriptional regulator [Saliniramus sp.]
MQAGIDGTGDDERQSPGEGEREFLIGDLAQEFGVSLRTLRFYEDRGMLSPRRDGSTRIYSESDRMRLVRILKGKQLGFTLTEIGDMLVDTNDGNGDLKLSLALVEQQLAVLEDQKREIEHGLEELRATRARLLSGAPRP